MEGSRPFRAAFRLGSSWGGVFLFILQGQHDMTDPHAIGSRILPSMRMVGHGSGLASVAHPSSSVSSLRPFDLLAEIRNSGGSLRWSFSRTKDVWYADERVSIKPRELRRIEEVSGVTYGRQEIGEVDRLIARADAILAHGGARLDRPLIAALRAFVGAADRAGTGRGAR